MSLYLKELEELKSKLGDNNETLSKDEKRNFWRIVGKIKRMDRPDGQEIQLATAIREKIYKNKLGESIPLLLPLIIFNLAGLAFIASPVLFSFDQYYLLAMIISWIGIALFVGG